MKNVLGLLGLQKIWTGFNAMMIVDVGPLLHKMLDAMMIGAVFGWFSALAFGAVGDTLWNVIMMAVMALIGLVHIKNTNISVAFWTNSLSW